MSQMKDYKLIEIGKHQYAWAGKECRSGGGGESSCDWSLYAPIKQHIKLIAQEMIEHSYESVVNDYYTEDTGEVLVLNHQPIVNGYYPLLVKIRSEISKVNKNGNYINKKVQNSQYHMTFNSQKQQYQQVQK